jgi:hypothetical protein
MVPALHHQQRIEEMQTAAVETSAFTCTLPMESVILFALTDPQ